MDGVDVNEGKGEGNRRKSIIKNPILSEEVGWSVVHAIFVSTVTNTARAWAATQIVDETLTRNNQKSLKRPINHLQVYQ